MKMGLMKINFIAIIMVFAVITFTPPIFAADRVELDRKLLVRPGSTVEEVGVAFLKVSESLPDFNKIVTESESYKSLDTLAQKDFLAKNVIKLQKEFLDFSPKKSDLIIRMKVNTFFNRTPDGLGKLEVRTFKQDPIYFPFYFANYPIALIPKDMELFKNIELSEDETNIVYSRLALDGAATLLLQLYPIAANDTKPVIFDNIPQYPMLTEIGYIGFLNRKGEQIWAWQNEKYNNKKFKDGSSQSLIDLIPEDKNPLTTPNQ